MDGQAVVRPMEREKRDGASRPEMDGQAVVWPMERKRRWSK